MHATHNAFHRSLQYTDVAGRSAIQTCNAGVPKPSLRSVSTTTPNPTGSDPIPAPATLSPEPSAEAAFPPLRCASPSLVRRLVDQCGMARRMSACLHLHVGRPTRHAHLHSPPAAACLSGRPRRMSTSSVCMYACSVRMCDMRDITSCAHAADSNAECDDEDAEADTLKRTTRTLKRTTKTLKRTRRRCRRTSRGRGGRSRPTGGERSGGRRAKQQNTSCCCGAARGWKPRRDDEGQRPT